MIELVRRMFMLTTVLAIGCGGGDESDGEVGGHCYPNGTCNVGLHCVAGYCSASPAIDASVDGSLVDAPPDALVCIDSSFEPNDSVQSATITGVATTKLTQTIQGLMICPAGDKDHFAVTITAANQNLEMLIDYGGASDPQGSILNAGGTPLANASVVNGQRRRAFLANLPVGTYYAMVFSSPTKIASYQLTVTVTGP